MKFNKNKIIAGIIIILVLGITFWYGGNAPGLSGWNVKLDAGTSSKDTIKDSNSKDKDLIKDNIDESEEEIAGENIEKTDGKNKQSKGNVEEIDVKESKDREKRIESRPGGKDENLSPSEKIELAKKIDKESQSKTENVSKSSSEIQEGKKGLNTGGKEKYGTTNAAPEGRPKAIEPENSKITNIEKNCTLSVRCDTILNNMDWLNPDKIELVPEDGVIYATKKVVFYEGESVFNLLLREMKKSKIHMEFTNTPMYDSAYIEGINNLYEFDCGELSGWMYKVNGWFPNYGASKYALKEGDAVEFVYTCDLGVDIRGFSDIGGD